MTVLATNLAPCPRDGVIGLGGSATSVTDSDSVTSLGKMRVQTMGASATTATNIGLTSTGQVTAGSKFGWPVTPGLPYAAQLRLKVTTMGGTGTSLQLRIYWYDTAGAQLSISTLQSQASPTLNTVYPFQGVAAAPAGAAWAVIRPSLLLTGASGSVVWRVDAIMFEQSSVVHAYTDGSLANCAWAGTPDASSSSRSSVAASVAFTGSGTLTAAARRRARGAAAFTGSATLGVAGRRRARGSVALTSTADIAVRGRAIRRGSLALSGECAFTVRGIAIPGLRLPSRVRGAGTPLTRGSGRTSTPDTRGAGVGTPVTQGQGSNAPPTRTRGAWR